jgi:CDGSH-type Zn-finger protein
VVAPWPNGPLFVRGRIRIETASDEVREATRVALCRCGQSANNPFCDGTHRDIGFTAP